MKRIIIFGAGGFGARYSSDVLLRGEEKIVCFLDNSKAKQGTQINGIDVLSPERIQDLTYDDVVVVTPGFEDDIVQQLKELDVSSDKIKIGGGG
jgi:FlaA1/EpsC-like NDP-sugar epimerase